MPPEQVARDDLVSRLPPTYALALRLRAARLPDDLIARCLDVEPEAVGPLLQLAEAKLVALSTDDAPVPVGPGAPPARRSGDVMADRVRGRRAGR